MKCHTCTAIMLALGLVAESANSALVVEFDGTSGTSVAGVAGLNISANLDLTRGVGALESSGSTFNSRGFDGLNLTDAIANDDYLSFGFAPNSGFLVDLMDVQVELDRSGTGPLTVELLSNIGGFTDGASLGSFAVPDPGSVLTFDISSLTNVVSSTEFRLYAYGASSAAGTMDIEGDLIGGGSGSVGLQVNGTVSAVPEPSAFLIFGMCSIAMCVIRYFSMAGSGPDLRPKNDDAL